MTVLLSKFRPLCFFMFTFISTFLSSSTPNYPDCVGYVCEICACVWDKWLCWVGVIPQVPFQYTVNEFPGFTFWVLCSVSQRCGWRWTLKPYISSLHCILVCSKATSVTMWATCMITPMINLMRQCLILESVSLAFTNSDGWSYRYQVHFISHIISRQNPTEIVKLLVTSTTGSCIYYLG